MILFIEEKLIEGDVNNKLDYSLLSKISKYCGITILFAIIIGGLIDILDFIVCVFQTVIDIVKKIKKKYCEEKKEEEKGEGESLSPFETKEVALAVIKPLEHQNSRREVKV